MRSLLTEHRLKVPDEIRSASRQVEIDTPFPDPFQEPLRPGRDRLDILWTRQRGKDHLTAATHLGRGRHPFGPALQ